LNKVLKNSDQRSCHGFHTFRDVGSGGAGGRKPPQILAPPPDFWPPHYNSPSQILRPSGIPAHEKTQAFKSR